MGKRSVVVLSMPAPALFESVTAIVAIDRGRSFVEQILRLSVGSQRVSGERRGAGATFAVVVVVVLGGA